MKAPLYIILCLLIFTAVNLYGASDVTFSDLIPYQINNNGWDNYTLDKTFDIGNNVKVRLEGRTFRGSGTLEFDNWQVKFFDQYNDSEVFLNNGLLNIKFIDINSDGYKDLIIYGVKAVFDEKYGKELIACRPEFLIFVYQKDQKGFFHTTVSMDPYSVFRKYYDIPVESRVLLPTKYLYNRGATCDKILHDVDDDGIEDQLEYGLKQGKDRLRIYLKISRGQ